LESKLGELKESLDAADSQRIRLEKALVGGIPLWNIKNEIMYYGSGMYFQAACSEPLGVSEQCLAHRTQRRGIDLCVDNVQKHLEYEIATIQVFIHFSVSIKVYCSPTPSLSKMLIQL
jgi:hypothetical protein